MSVVIMNHLRKDVDWLVARTAEAVSKDVASIAIRDTVLSVRVSTQEDYYYCKIKPTNYTDVTNK